jgi:hypothetical protein
MARDAVQSGDVDDDGTLTLVLIDSDALLIADKRR